MHIEPLISPRSTIVLPSPTGRDDVLARAAQAAHARFPAVPEGTLLEALHEREGRFPTSTPEGVAFPHALLPEIDDSHVVTLLLKPGVRWSQPNHPPQDLVFAIFGSSETPWQHVRLLARLARLIKRPGVLQSWRTSPDEPSLYDRLLAEDRADG